MTGKKVFRSFRELREHFFPEQAKKEKARAEVEATMKKEVKRGFEQAFSRPGHKQQLTHEQVLCSCKGVGLSAAEVYTDVDVRGLGNRTRE